MIRQSRMGRHWTLDRLSAEMPHRPTRAHLSDIELGRREPGVSLMDELATALDLPYDYFCWLYGRWPADLRNGEADERTICAAFAAFRREIARARTRPEGTADGA